jgi:transcriptional regulator with XRE-family HTH domain
MISDRFPVRLKELREAAGLTQQQLADRSKLALGVIRKLERGANGPTWATVCALTDALGVDCTAFTQTPASDGLQLRMGRPPKPKGDEAEKPKRPRGRPRKGG